MRIRNVVTIFVSGWLLVACGGEDSPPAPEAQPAAAQPAAAKPAAAKPKPAAMPKAPPALESRRLRDALANQKPDATAEQLDCWAKGIEEQLGMDRFTELVALKMQGESAAPDAAATADIEKLDKIQSDCGLSD